MYCTTEKKSLGLKGPLKKKITLQFINQSIYSNHKMDLMPMLIQLIYFFVQESTEYLLFERNDHYTLNFFIMNKQYTWYNNDIYFMMKKGMIIMIILT